ncbi:helix-turn-helix transcriptional regulator [Erythrobacter sp. EC-HK427]|uniref:helix-turn-helix transcriptional regulator n=1 Tax=Erythrobacter sp. EC-HK427 TaxID=2038396 RepID=UPI00125633A0|nr:LuxR C-terminal-related transcriptional regulator [Erythrobacter sp. EC-HK427]VVT12371.1 conserved hypothetical protein [Erythrobacter sp. EC-HK427]
MSTPLKPRQRAAGRTLGDRRVTLVAGVVVVQAVAAIFFLADAVVDIAEDGWGWHVISEAAIAFALLAGVVAGAYHTRYMVERARRDAEALTIARGALAEQLQARFEEWKLTAAESDVALLSLKGFETAEISRLRNVAEGTVRAQLTSIYAKSGVSSRHGLLSQFFDDLIELGDA